MDPKYTEERPEDRASERAADATEETRERRGADDVRIEDDETRDEGYGANE
jgi:hypothetical protein